MNAVHSPIKIRILFFAKTRELSGSNVASFQLNQAQVKVSELRDLLCATFNLGVIKQNIILALNENYCDDPDQQLNLRENDEIALIPPISGG